jgi:hypothetical protein
VPAGPISSAEAIPPRPPHAVPWAPPGWIVLAGRERAASGPGPGRPTLSEHDLEHLDVVVAEILIVTNTPAAHTRLGRRMMPAR